MRMGIMTAMAAFALGGAASAGTLTAVGDGGGTYSLTDCMRPTAPDLAIDPALKGREAVSAHNEKVKRYNAHVEEVNAYLACIANEAGRDLQLYYQAVQASLDAEQNAVLNELRAQGDALDVRY